jgi:hypothetical protein
MCLHVFILFFLLPYVSRKKKSFNQFWEIGKRLDISLASNQLSHLGPSSSGFERKRAMATLHPG